MAITLETFFPESWATTYAQRHYATDSGIQDIYYLPEGSPRDEIRLLEINADLIERVTDPADPLTLGVDEEGAHPHRVSIVDVTPHQWSQILGDQISLPDGWSIRNRILLPRA